LSSPKIRIFQTTQQLKRVKNVYIATNNS